MKTPIFGKVHKLLCCQNSAYLICQQTSNTYDERSDLFYVEERNGYEIVGIDQLAAYHPLESYLVSEGHRNSISLIHYVVEHLNN